MMKGQGEMDGGMRKGGREEKLDQDLRWNEESGMEGRGRKAGKKIKDIKGR